MSEPQAPYGNRNDTESLYAQAVRILGQPGGWQAVKAAIRNRAAVLVGRESRYEVAAAVLDILCNEPQIPNN